MLIVVDPVGPGAWPIKSHWAQMSMFVSEILFCAMVAAYLLSRYARFSADIQSGLSTAGPTFSVYDGLPVCFRICPPFISITEFSLLKVVLSLPFDLPPLSSHRRRGPRQHLHKIKPNFQLIVVLPRSKTSAAFSGCYYSRCAYSQKTHPNSPN